MVLSYVSEIFKIVMFVHINVRKTFIDQTYVYYFLLFSD